MVKKQPKKYSKKKQEEVSGPLASNPGYRTPDFAKIKNNVVTKSFNPVQRKGGMGFNPASFKGPQHKG